MILSVSYILFLFLFLKAYREGKTNEWFMAQSELSFAFRFVIFVYGVS